MIIYSRRKSYPLQSANKYLIRIKVVKINNGMIFNLKKNYSILANLDRMYDQVSINDFEHGILKDKEVIQI